MGGASSKTEKSEALRLCKARKRFIKQAIDSRYAFAASHVAYVQSLRNIGIALRRFAEAEVLVESSLSTSVTELDKTPSHSSYPSPSPPHIAELSDSPLPAESPLSQPLPRLSYMRAGGTSSVTVRMGPYSNGYAHNGESVTFSMPPPPPEPGSWDFFEPNDGLHVNFDNMGDYRQVSEIEAGLDNGVLEGTVPPELSQKGCKFPINFVIPRNRSNGSLMPNSEATTEHVVDCELVKQDNEQNANEFPGNRVTKAALEPSSSSKGNRFVAKKDVTTSAEREDPSEFITHRAKDFLSSIKDIEHRFSRASEAGKEVSRMLEANNIRVGYSEAKDPSEHTTKVITWKRSASSRSSSSRNALASGSKDGNDDTGSDFAEEFCMIAGSHSSTLDRLYAWERKLYDEVKVCRIFILKPC
ncbi:hypothetical protein U1Q18_011249 [Sarracenia purpurea var. burkii]